MTAFPALSQHRPWPRSSNTEAAGARQGRRCGHWLRRAHSCLHSAREQGAHTHTHTRARTQAESVLTRLLRAALDLAPRHPDSGPAPLARSFGTFRLVDARVAFHSPTFVVTAQYGSAEQSSGAGGFLDVEQRCVTGRGATKRAQHRAAPCHCTLHEGAGGGSYVHESPRAPADSGTPNK